MKSLTGLVCWSGVLLATVLVVFVLLPQRFEAANTITESKRTVLNRHEDEIGALEKSITSLKRDILNLAKRMAKIEKKAAANGSAISRTQRDLKTLTSSLEKSGGGAEGGESSSNK